VFRFALALAVGPAPVELERTADLIDSLCAFEPGPWYFVMVDDGAEDRRLDRAFRFPADCTAVSLPHGRRGRDVRYRRSKGICAAVLEAFAWIARHAPDARFTMKLDTDALVIGPFAEKIAGVLATNPDVGMLGAYDRTPNGGTREFVHARTVRDLLGPRGLLRRFVSRDGPRGAGVIRQHIAAALARGYRLGEHCLGGAYGVPAELLRRMLAAGYLDGADLWRNVDCPEDVMVGMYTRAVGLRLMNFVDAGQVFGVSYRGLPDAPERLLDRGYSVIHSVKSWQKLKEANVRAFYRRRREAVA
jgi:hypothetical protein